MDGQPPIAARLWKQIPAVVQAAILKALRRFWKKIDRLQGRNQELERKVQQLEQQVRALQERLGKNSSNSSKPPSSDGPTSSAPRPSREAGGGAADNPAIPSVSASWSRRRNARK